MHSIGSTVLPAVPGTPDRLEALGEELRRIIELNCDQSWGVLAPGEPLVRKVIPHAPDEGDFKATELPALFIWAAAEPRRQQVADSLWTRESEVQLLWVQAPANAVVANLRSPFWQALSGALQLAADVGWYSVDTTTEAWGQNVRNKLGFWDFSVGPGALQEVSIQTGTQNTTYDGFTWPLTVTERLVPDALLDSPVSPAAQNATLTTGEDSGTPVLTLAESRHPLA